MSMRNNRRHPRSAWSVLQKKFWKSCTSPTAERPRLSTLRRADVPSAKEPTGLVRTDGKRPDGLTLIPWQGGRSLTWDVTVVDTFAASYLAANSFAVGGTAAAAVVHKSAKYATLATTHIFMPIALETLGTMNTEALDFFADLGRRIAANSNDNRETSFLFQRLSVIVQR
jgi:hypothetical protein